MAKACDFKTSEASTKAWFRTNGAIDKFLNIKDLRLFRKFNVKWSNYARLKYGVTEQLFHEEQGGTKAVPNKVAFKNIDTKRGVFYQKSNDAVDMEDTVEVNLSKFLDNYGITVEYVDSLKERGFDAVAIADITNKMILISNGEADASTLPEEAAHFAVELLGDSNPIVQRLMEIIPNSEVYQDVLDEYSTDPEYTKNGKPDTYKLKKEAIGKAIANSMIKKQAENKTVLGALKRLWNKVTSMFKKVNREALNEEMNRLTGNLAKQIQEGTVEGADVANLTKSTIFKSKKVSKEEDRARKALLTLETRLQQIGRRLDAPESLLTLKSTIAKIQESIDNNQYLLGISKYMSTVEEASQGIIEAMEQDDTSYSADVLYDINDFLNLHEKTVSDIVAMMRGDRYLMERGSEIFEGSKTILGNLGEMKAFLSAEMEKATIAGVDSVAYSEGLGESLFQDADSDLNFFSTWLGAAKNASKEIVRLLDKKLRDITYAVDRYILSLGNELKTMQMDLERSGFKDFGKLYEKDAKGKKTGYLIREKNWGKYKAAKEEYKKTIMELMTGDREYDYNKWVTDNQDEQNVTNLTNLWKKFYDENTVRKDHKRIPNDSYNNPEFKKLMSNPKVKEYYEKLVEIKQDAVAKLPHKYRNDHYVYWMPQIRKDTLNRLKSREQNVFRTVKELAKETVNIQKDETEYGNHEIIKNPITGEEIKFLPIHYHAKLDDMNNLSDDITSMYLSYAYMAENYNQKALAKGDIWLIQEAVRNQKVTPSTGKQKAEGESNTYKMIDNMINTRFYGKAKDKQVVKVGKYEVEVTKAVDSFMGYVRRNNLVMNMFTHTANYVMGQAYQKVENLAGKYTTAGSSLHAEGILARNFPGMLADVGKRVKTNKVSLVMQKNDIIHDIHSSYNHLDERTKVGRVFSKSGLYATYEATDAHVKGKIVLSVYDNYRLYDGKFVNYMQFKTLNKGEKNVKQMWKALRPKSLYNAYNNEGGQLVVKPEFEDYVTPNLENRIRGVINQIVDEADGTLTMEDKAMLHRSVWGRAILTHRNWLLVGMQARWKKGGFNYVTEMEEEGYHRTFWNNFKKLLGIGNKNDQGESIETFMQRFKSMLLLNEDMDPMEKANMKKAWADWVFILTAIFVARMLNSLAEDEPDEWSMQFLGYMGSRIKLEATAYSNPFEILDILDSPTAGLNQIESFAGFIKDAMPEYDDVEGWNWRMNDEIDRGGYKGKSRWEKFMIKRSFLKPFYEFSTTDVIKDKNQYLKQIGL